LQPNLFAQHARLKSQYPGIILLLCVGDFYEAFDEDADTIARVLSLPLTSRAEHRMAGFPHMQLDRFLTALVGPASGSPRRTPFFDKPLPGKPEVVRRLCADEEG